MATVRKRKEDLKADEALRLRLKALVGMLDSGERVALRLGMSAATLYRRIKTPADLTVRELRAMERLEARLKGGAA